MSVSTISYVVWGAIGVIALALWWLSYVRPSAAAHPGAPYALTNPPGRAH